MGDHSMGEVSSETTTGRRAQSEVEASFFTTEELRGGISKELTELAVTQWLRTIQPKYGKYAKGIVDSYDYTTELLVATPADLERCGLKFPAARAIVEHIGY